MATMAVRMRADQASEPTYKAFEISTQRGRLDWVLSLKEDDGSRSQFLGCDLAGSYATSSRIVRLSQFSTVCCAK